MDSQASELEWEGLHQSLRLLVRGFYKQMEQPFSVPPAAPRLRVQKLLFEVPSLLHVNCF